MEDVTTPSRLEATREEHAQLAVARLVVVGTFVALWIFLWLIRIPYPVPFLLVLVLEGAAFGLYSRVVRLAPTERAINAAYYAVLAVELVLLTAMVYFLGGLSFFGAYAYVFGLIFTNSFVDVRRGVIYTTSAAAAFTSLVLLDATGVIPHTDTCKRVTYGTPTHGSWPPPSSGRPGCSSGSSVG